MMQMSEKEIVRSYTNAKDKRSQVGVLAELNACPNDTIREILERNGISAPKPGRKSQKKEEPKKPKAQLTAKGKLLLKNEEPKTTDCKDCAMSKACGYGKPDGEHCDAFTPKAKLLLKNEEQTESSKVSAPSDSSKLMSQNDVGTHQQDVGTKSEKVVTLGDLIGLIDRDRENNKTISIMDENGAEQLRVLTRSPFLEDLEEYVVTDLDVGDKGWICVWLGKKKEE